MTSFLRALIIVGSCLLIVAYLIFMHGETPLATPNDKPSAQTVNSVPEPAASETITIYPPHPVMATVFWIGEGASADNDNITNVVTAWDEKPVNRFGGVDDPEKRSGVLPVFEPQSNPFYFALPAAEFDNNGLIVESRQKSYWAEQKVLDNESLFKGRWIKVSAGTNVVYAQWVDVGPNEEQDYDYVFGNAQPKNTFDQKAGLDLSPAAAMTLGFNDGSLPVTWQFIDEKDVPEGLWTSYPLITRTVYW